jgi:hypothetical protein
MMYRKRQRRDESCEKRSFTYYDNDDYFASPLLQEVRLNSSTAGSWRGKYLGCSVRLGMADDHQLMTRWRIQCRCAVPHLSPSTISAALLNLSRCARCDRCLFSLLCLTSCRVTRWGTRYISQCNFFVTWPSRDVSAVLRRKGSASRTNSKL